MVRESDLQPEGCGFKSQVRQDCRWGEWMSSALSTLNTTTEVRPLSKAPNLQLLPGRRSIGCPLLRVCVHNVCVCSLLTAVCVHLDGLNSEHKFQVWETILGHTSRPFLPFPFHLSICHSICLSIYALGVMYYVKYIWQMHMLSAYNKQL